jgi:hypothetical protein
MIPESKRIGTIWTISIILTILGIFVIMMILLGAGVFDTQPTQYVIPVDSPPMNNDYDCDCSKDSPYPTEPNDCAYKCGFISYLPGTGQE